MRHPSPCHGTSRSCERHCCFHPYAAPPEPVDPVTCVSVFIVPQAPSVCVRKPFQLCNFCDLCEHHVWFEFPLTSLHGVRPTPGIVRSEAVQPRKPLDGGKGETPENHCPWCMVFGWRRHALLCHVSCCSDREGPPGAGSIKPGINNGNKPLLLSLPSASPDQLLSTSGFFTSGPQFILLSVRRETPFFPPEEIEQVDISGVFMISLLASLFPGCHRPSVHPGPRMRGKRHAARERRADETISEDC